MTFEALLGKYLVVALIVSGCLACSPEGYMPKSPLDKTFDNQIVLLGRVTDKHPHPEWDTAYSVDMEVLCVLKTTSDCVIDDNIRIEEGGTIECIYYLFFVLKSSEDVDRIRSVVHIRQAEAWKKIFVIIPIRIVYVSKPFAHSRATRRMVNSKT